MPSRKPAFPPLRVARRESEIERASETSKGHGRVEKRTIEVTSALAEYLQSDWSGCAQVFRLTREGLMLIEVTVSWTEASGRPHQVKLGAQRAR